MLSASTIEDKSLFFFLAITRDRSPIAVRHEGRVLGPGRSRCAGIKAPGLSSLFYECTFCLSLLVPRDYLARLLVSSS